MRCVPRSSGLGTLHHAQRITCREGLSHPRSGPIVQVSTRAADGRAYLMTMGFHMMIQHDPPLVGMVVRPWDYSHQALSETGECVLAVATVDLAEMVVGIGNCSGDALDKFAHFGLTPAPAHTVGAPLVRECWANLECRVADDGWARRYNLWVLEVQRIWIDPEREEARLIHHQGMAVSASMATGSTWASA